MKHNDIKRASQNDEMHCQIQLRRLICFAPLCLALIAGCKKTEPTTAAPQPSAAPVNAAPAAPAVPVPTFSAAQKIRMFVYPKNNQTHDQQLIDESGCYDTVAQQTGINPEAGGPQAPTSADVAAAQQQGAADAPQSSGGRVRGAGKGALGGAAVGAISGNAGGALQSVRRWVLFEEEENNGKRMRLLRSREHKRPSRNSSRRIPKARPHTTSR